MDILFGVRLHRYGIDAHAGRNTARLALAAELPASVLADLTGISVSTAERWSQWAKRDWAAYVGQRAADDREASTAGNPLNKPSRTFLIGTKIRLFNGLLREAPAQLR